MNMGSSNITPKANVIMSTNEMKSPMETMGRVSMDSMYWYMNSIMNGVRMKYENNMPMMNNIVAGIEITARLRLSLAYNPGATNLPTL